MSGKVAFGGGKILAISMHPAVSKSIRLGNVVIQFIRRLVKGYDDVTALYELDYGI